MPGLVIGALSFGHLPAVFIPAGPMTSGLPNDQKAKIRQLFAEGKVDRAALLESEAESYHGPGTCTFYGTANTNQMMMEIMGMHLPGASFVNPNTPMRDALTLEAARRALADHGTRQRLYPHGADARRARLRQRHRGAARHRRLDQPHAAHRRHGGGGGIKLTWADFSDLADIVPLLCRVYPNGKADVNHFHAAGGMGFIIRELLGHGLLHRDVETVFGHGLDAYTKEPALGADGQLTWRDGSGALRRRDRAARHGRAPFHATGGLKLLDGALGRAVLKTSAVAPERHIIEAPARVFHSQEALQRAFKAGELTGDMVAVVRFQGPKANGMPELHKLMPPLGVLQDRGHRVALVTDGRLSGRLRQGAGRHPCDPGGGRGWSHRQDP